MNPSRFRKGDRVQYRSDLSKVGVVMNAPTDTQGVWWYQISLAGGGREWTPESDLEPYEAQQDPQSLFVQGRFGGPEDLIRKVTFHKLRQPLENTLYSLGTSRTEFYPHQYKPLLKFIDSQDQRLLIADEVGLGKTIEAGLIMVELRARRQLQSAVVVCPSALTGKWRDEMSRRFDEEYRVLSSVDLRKLLTDFQERGEIPELRAIISLQSLRQSRNRDLLEAMALPIDLVIVDEAHHLRNPETQSHHVVEALCVGALSIVFLTATPIHLGSENLFHLLHLLQPGEFDDLAAFEERLHANVPVVEAERLARQRPVPTVEILRRLESLRCGPRARFFDGSPFLERCLGMVSSREDLSLSAQVALASELKDLNLLSHIVTRSRKRDVFAKVAVRSPSVVAPTPTREEMDFYHAVTHFVRERHAAAPDAAGLFAAITAQRQVASSMQAARVRFSELALREVRGVEESDIDSDTWVEAPGEEEQTLTVPQQLLLAAQRLGDTDTKAEALLGQLDALEREEPGRKVVVFSYFKGTLRYLQDRLKRHGVPCVRIDGDVPSDPYDMEKDERGRLIRQFREDPSVRVLLSSEVGSEGLDFQFAHILVNYDLPWNPMRVEQRIGRLDRIGQEASRIIIINLSLPGTIEHRILERLYQRIGIFRQSLGDLEAILGEVIERLTRDLLSRHLTAEEEEARIDQAATVLEERLRLLATLEREGERLVGAGAYFDEQLERARSGGETIGQGDLEIFLREFLRRRFPDSELRRDGKRQSLRVDERMLEALRELRDGRPLWLRLLRRLVAQGRDIPVTFDPAEAFRNPDLEFLAPHHPVFSLATEHYEKHAEQLHPVSAIRVLDDGSYGSREFVYGVYQLTVSLGSGRGRHRLEPIFVSVSDGEVLEPHRSSLLFGTILRSGAREEVQSWDAAEAERTMEILNGVAITRFGADRKALIERQAARVQARLVSLESSFRRKWTRKQELLAKARASGLPPHYLRLLQGTCDNLEADHRARSRELEREREVAISFSLVAAGLVRVEA